jgi:hypothetical protein
VQQVGGHLGYTGPLFSRKGSGAPGIRSYTALSEATDPDELTSLAMQSNWLRSIGFARRMASFASTIGISDVDLASAGAAALVFRAAHG